MTRKDFENELKKSGYVKRQEDQYIKTGENPYHKIIVELDNPGEVRFYGTSISFSSMEIVQANYSDLDALAKQYNKKTSVEVLEDMIRNKIISYLSGYELCHKMYKIATKSGLQATRTGRKLYIGLEYNGKKYEIDYDSYGDYIIRTVSDKNTEETDISRIEIKDIAESVNGIEDVLNKAFNLPRTEVDLFKRVTEDEVEESEEEDSRL